MKKSGLLYILLAFIAMSCNKDNEFLDILPKPSGLYLKEIRVYGFQMMDKMDTLKMADFEYDNNRYLKKIWFYDYESQKQSSYNTFFYNKAGQIRQIDLFTIERKLMVREIFTYYDNHLVSDEVYKPISGKLRLESKLKFETEADGQITNEHLFFWQGSDLTESKFITKYYWNEEGNIYKTHYFGEHYEFIDEYEFDHMNSPFNNLGIPFSAEAISFFYIEYLSKNNVINHKQTYFDYTSISDTLVSAYGNEIHKYSRINYPLSVDGDEFYYYEYLK
jgi:hypothetical protein